MPLSMTGGLAHDSLFEDIDIQWLERVQADLTSPDQKTSPRHTILYRKMPRMKFKKIHYYHERVYEQTKDV
jgi:hypothetical protein